MGGTNRRQRNPGGATSLEDPTPESERRPYRHEERDMRVSESALESRGGFRAIGVAASKLATPLLAKRGGGILTRLKAQWAVIVGPEWASATWPIALGRDGALKLHAASGLALELQHRAPLLIERINLFLGRPRITRLALVQGPLPLVSPPDRSILRPLTPGETEGLAERVADVADPELRDALARLGEAVIRGQP
jgi:hypothetical protein